jgi:hypothetical protein
MRSFPRQQSNRVRRFSRSIKTRAWIISSNRLARVADAAGSAEPFTMRTNPTDGTYRVKTNVLQIWNDTTELYHPFFCDGHDVVSVYGAGDASAADADADMTASPVDGTYRVKNKNLQAWNEITELYHEFYPYGPNGGIVTIWGDGDSSPADPDEAINGNDPDADFRVINNGTTLQKWNPYTEQYHTLTLTGANAAIREAWGIGED